MNKGTFVYLKTLGISIWAMLIISILERAFSTNTQGVFTFISSLAAILFIYGSVNEVE